MEMYMTTSDDQQLLFTDDYLKIDDRILVYNKIRNINYRNIKHKHSLGVKPGLSFSYDNRNIFIPCDEDEKDKMMDYLQKALEFEKLEQEKEALEKEKIEKQKLEEKERKKKEEDKKKVNSVIKPAKINHIKEPIIQPDDITYIKCKICGKVLHRNGFGTHIKSHGLTKKEYDNLGKIDNINNNINKKYKLTEETKNIIDFKGNIRIVYRIQRLSDNKFGGWIESENNLSYEGNCWVDDEAVVCGMVKIKDNALIFDHSMIYSDNITEISGSVKVHGHAKINSHKSIIQDGVEIYDDAMIYDTSYISGNSKIYGDAHVYSCIIKDNVQIYEHAKINCIEVIDNAQICGYTNINNSNSNYELKIGGNDKLTNTKILINEKDKKNNSISINNNIKENKNDNTIITKTKRYRRPNFSFELLNIPVGATLTYVNDPTITCTVVNNTNKINFLDEIMTLTAAAKIILDLKPEQTVSGPTCFCYNGKLISQIYDELEVK